MAIPENQSISFDDEAFQQLAIRSFEAATKRAAEENDALGIPTPVGVLGKVLYLMNEGQDYVDVHVETKFTKTDKKHNNEKTKWMWIVAGPNGAGKTTFTRELLKNLGQPDLVALNADDRTQQLRPDYPNKTLPEINLMAAQQIDAEVSDCIRSGKTFLVETVLSSDKYRDDLLEAKSRGFQFGFIYISIEPAELSPARISVRVRKGGHDVDYDKAIQRWHKSHEQSLWFGKYADIFMFFDNSSRVQKTSGLCEANPAEPSTVKQPVSTKYPSYRISSGDRQVTKQNRDQSTYSPEELRSMIGSNREALKEFAPDTTSEDYGLTWNALGNCFAVLAVTEENGKNCHLAIYAYGKALEVLTPDRFPKENAMVWNNLGNAFSTLAEAEESTVNCRKAIEAFNEALKIQTPEQDPCDYAKTWFNLGIAYGILANDEERVSNLHHAIESFDEALKIYSIDQYPEDYASTHIYLGKTYGTLAFAEDKARNLHLAAGAYGNALKVLTPEESPEEYASTQYNLGSIYGALGGVEDTAENFWLAVVSYRGVLEVLTTEQNPVYYAMTWKHLGDVYHLLIGEEEAGEMRASRAYSAIEAYINALKIFNPDEYPEQYVDIMTRSGDTWWLLSEIEDTPENRGRSEEAYAEATRTMNESSDPRIRNLWQKYVTDIREG